MDTVMSTALLGKRLSEHPDKDGKGIVEKHFALSGASSVSDYLRLMKPPRGGNVSLPFLSCLCLDVLK